MKGGKALLSQFVMSGSCVKCTGEKWCEAMF